MSEREKKSIAELASLALAKWGTSESLLKNVIESTINPIAALDTNFNFLLSNSAHRQLMKRLFDFEIKVGENYLHKLRYLEIVQQQQQKVWQNAFNGESFTILEEIQSQEDGELHYYEVDYAPVRDQRQGLIGAIAISRDVTDNKRKEKRIEELLAMQEKLIENLERQNEELATQEEEIRQANEELISTNNYLEIEQKRLLRLTNKLKERNFELDQIMYKTSHDIRSPIASVLGLLSIIKEEDALPKIREYLSFIEQRTLSLDRFTQSMLNYGRTQRGSLKIESVDFEQIIAQCLENFKFLNTFDRLQKDVNIQYEADSFYSDAFRISIVFGNIISNAVKYQNLHKKDNHLKINALIKREGAEIIFQDNGIGVAEEHLPKIFDMFYRATEKSDGSGLGMYIVRQTIKRLRGRIRMESVLHEGTKISIWLPNLKS